MKNPQYRQLFKNKNFVRLWISHTLSQLTINIMNFYVLTRIFSVTGSSIAVSLMWLAGSLPALLFGPFSGAVVDSFSRRKILIVTNLLQALTVFCALFVGSHVFALYVIVFFYWAFDQLYLPSQQASVPYLVDKNYLDAANGLFLLTQQTSFLIGMGLGGVLLSLLGPVLTVVAITINLLLASFSVYFLPSDRPKTELFEKDLFQFFEEFKDGYEFIKNHRSVMLPLATIILSQIFISIIATTIPSYTQNVLGVNLNHAGVIMLVPGTIGALIITYLFPRLAKKYRKKKIIEAGFVVSGLSLLSLAVLGMFPSIKVALAILSSIGIGVSIAVIIIPTQTLIQQHTPAWLRGRVYGQLSFLLILSTTLPLLISASIADALGVSSLVAILGSILLGVFVFINRRGDFLLNNHSS